MNSNAILVALFGAAFVLGAAGVFFGTTREGAAELFWISAFVGITLIFLWVSTDARERGYRRTAALNVAVIAFAAIAVPIYLYKSRPAGSRLKAIGGFVLAGLGYFAASFLGAFVAAIIRL